MLFSTSFKWKNIINTQHSFLRIQNRGCGLTNVVTFTNNLSKGVSWEVDVYASFTNAWEVPQDMMNDCDILFFCYIMQRKLNYCLTVQRCSQHNLRFCHNKGHWYNDSTQTQDKNSLQTQDHFFLQRRIKVGCSMWVIWLQ